MNARRIWRISRLGPLAALVTTAMGLPAITGVSSSLLGSGSASASPEGFEVGAAQVDITPPALASSVGQQLDAAEFVPYCGTSEPQIQQLWPGKRLFAFEKPYIDQFGTGQYVPGDPYCDADASHRYEAPYIAGGSGDNHWPLYSADTESEAGFGNNTPATEYCPSIGTACGSSGASAASPDAIGAEAVVFEVGGHRVVDVSVDSIGIFDSTMDQIRAAVGNHESDIEPNDIFISSTHDESAPDPIGLWGPDLSQDPSPTLPGPVPSPQNNPVKYANGTLPAGATSGVDEYYVNWMVDQVASAVVRADKDTAPASLRLTTARMPSNLQSCWSSYPFIDTNLMPVMQGVKANGEVVFTLANIGTHDESLAFSGNSAYTSMLSGDWTGRLRDDLEATYGGVGMEMAGLVGSVETPALYEPETTQVLNVPGAHHGLPGNPVDGCSSIYPEPSGVSGATLETDALRFVDEYGQSVADTTAAALGPVSPASPNVTVFAPSEVSGQTKGVCLQLENNFFVAAFAADLFPDRPAYADPLCTVGVSAAGSLETGLGGQSAILRPGAPMYIRSEVGVITLGAAGDSSAAQIAYSPGEVFPVTEVSGPFDRAQMPFPTNCYLPDPNDPSNPNASGADYNCGNPLPMTPPTSEQMTAPFRFLAGLGEDMVGYLFPPGNFVGDQPETLESPWFAYENSTGTSHDRFGYGHSDDSESVGPYAGLATADALSALLKADPNLQGAATDVVAGMFVDASGRLCDSPFPYAAAEDTGDAAGGSWVGSTCSTFSGAVGIRVDENGHQKTICVVAASTSVCPDGADANGWATYLSTPDGGTAGTSYGYSTATRGVMVGGSATLLDVVAGAQDPVVSPAS